MSRHRKYPVPWTACLIGILTVPAFSAEWTTSAGVAPAITYSDNVCLSSDDEQGEWIALVTPDIAIQAEGGKARFDLVADVEINSLTDSKLDDLGCNPRVFGSRNQFTPRLNANADAELIDNWLFVDADASVSQNAVTSFAAGGGDSLDRTGNTNTTSRYSVSPYLSRRFDDDAHLLLRYGWDEQYNSKDTVGDSTQQTVLFSLDTIPGTAKTELGLEASYDKLERDATPNQLASDSELKSVQLNFGYQVLRDWQLTGFYGEERNDFVSSLDEIDGDYWGAGVRWTPGPRTTIEIGSGDRFFGDTPWFSLSHRHKRSLFSAEFAKTLTYDRNIRTTDSGIPVNDNGTTISTSPIVDERFTLAYTYNGRRSTVQVTANHSDQSRTQDGRDTRYESVFVSFNRNISRSLIFRTQLTWREDKPLGERSQFVRDSETWRAVLGVEQKLGGNTQLALDYQFTDRSSDSAINEYVENRFTVTLNFDF